MTIEQDVLNRLKEEIIEYIIDKCGYKGTKNSKQYPTTLNKRISKALQERDLFYDRAKVEMELELSKKLESCKINRKFMFEFIEKNGLLDKYKKEALKELVVYTPSRRK